MSVDKSFLRLLTDFSLAKSEIMIDSEFIYNAPICLHPQERYLQITNLYEITNFDSVNLETPQEIADAFKIRVLADGGTFEAYNCLLSILPYNYKVEIINCSGETLKDITTNIFIESFVDTFGVQQFAFEIQPIQDDFYFTECYLKISFENYDTILYSNGFYVTAEYENKTFRIDYKNVGYYQGISYDVADYYQSIRLFGYFNQPSTKESVTIYTQLNGQVRRSRPIQGMEYKYNIDLIDTFTFERLSCALNSQIVYLNGKRFQTIDNVQSEERQGKSNMFATSFKGQFNYSDTYIDNNQLIEPFNYTELYPLSTYGQSNPPTTFKAEFNRLIESVEYIELWNKSPNVKITDLTPTISGSDISGLLSLGVGSYYILFKVTSVYGEVIEVTDKNIWAFNVKLGDYSSTHYTNDYITA